MKKIFNIILAAAALLAFVPAANAQSYINEGGLCYSKTISEPNADGIYTITLESFVTGKVTIKNESVPADVILVLDFSNSMKTNNYGDVTRLEALKTAVNAFVDKIALNDGYSDEAGTIRRKDAQGNETTLGNRIAIVSYNRDTTTFVKYQDVFANASTIKSTVSAQNPNQSNTRTDLGMDAAKNLLAGTVVPYRTGRNENSSKTVVLFTDGAPATSQNEFNTTYANYAISYAQQIKNSTDYDATVYVVGLVESSDRNYANCITFMKRVSSNYPNATSMSAPGTGYTDDGDYFQDATQSDLTTIFETIAAASGGSDMDLSEATVTEVDVVSASFTLPPNADESSIKVYTAKCTGEDTDGTLLFADRVEAPNSEDTYEKWTKDEDGNDVLLPENAAVDVDKDITIKLSNSAGSTDANAKKDKIEADGFDYGNNWCGYKEALDGTKTYQGHKVIIEIPIMMDPTAVGGPNIETNAKGSGIYINGENKIEFKSPTVSLPVNIHINKQGLDVGESANFIIQRKLVEEADVDANWKPVTSVFVTRHKGQGKNDPLTKVVGMPSTVVVDGVQKDVVYRIVEGDWSWSYNSAAATATTTDKLVTNPFIFVNTKKNNIDYSVRHAESKATNTFNDNGGAGYDDSKSNGRTVIDVTASTETGGTTEGGNN